MARAAAATSSPASWPSTPPRPPGQSFVVENRGGGASVPGTQAVATAAPDGTTLGTADNALVLNPSLLATKLPYDTERDIGALGLAVTAPVLLLANPDAPARTVAEILAEARTQSGGLGISHGGIGTPTHLAVGAVPAGQRPAGHAGGLSRRRAAADRAGHRRGALRLRRRLLGDGPGPGRAAAAAGHHLRRPQPAAARGADHDRGRAAGRGYPGLVGLHHAGRRAARDHRGGCTRPSSPRCASRRPPPGWRRWAIRSSPARRRTSPPGSARRSPNGGRCWPAPG